MHTVDTQTVQVSKFGVGTQVEGEMQVVRTANEQRGQQEDKNKRVSSGHLSLHYADGFFGIGCAEHGRTGNQHISSCSEKFCGVIGIHATVNLHQCL